MLGTLGELAGRLGGRVVGDDRIAIARIAAVDEATPDALTFAVEERYFAAAVAGKAAAILVDADMPYEESAGKPLLVVSNARLALARLLAAFRAPRPRGPFRHATAVLEDDAVLGDDVYVGALAYVGPRAHVARGSVIDAGAYVGADARVGEDAWLQPRAMLMQGCSAGDRVVLHAGSVVGSEGFGWAFVDGRLHRIPQVGDVVLEADVEIGANACVDRAQTGSTRIGAGTKIDNLVQIGHNSHVGRHCAIAAQTGFAGSTDTGDYVKIAGQVGTRGHMTIGSQASVAGQSGVWGDVPDGATVSGNPARDHREQLRTEVMLRKLPKLVARMEALERDLPGRGE